MENKPEDDLGLSLLSTIGSEELSNISQDISEVAIDSILQDGLLRDIPIISSIVSTTKAVLSIRDKLLIRKIYSFLSNLREITEEEKTKISEKLKTNKKYSRKIGEHLILLLDRIDNLDKPAIIAKLFLSFIREEITHEEFIRYSSVIDRAFMDDIEIMLNTLGHKYHDGDEECAKRLHYLGLSKFIFDDSIYIKSAQELNKIPENPDPFHEPIKYEFNDDAKLIVQILTGKKTWDHDYIKAHKEKIKQLNESS